MEDGLVHLQYAECSIDAGAVLILIVMEDGLVL